MLNQLYKCLFVVEKIVIVVALINLLFLNFYITLFPASHITHRLGMVAICSTFNHPGKYGWFMLFCALAHLSRYHKTKDKREIKNIIISVLACLLSLRTKVILGVVICAFGYLFFTKREIFKRQIKKIAIFALLTLCLLVPFKETLSKTYTLYFTDAEGYSVRQALMDNSIKIIKDYFPLGVGFGKYGTWYASRDYSEYYFKYGMNNMYGMTSDNTSYATDTFWPAIFGETGALGSLVFITMLFIQLKQLIKNSQKSDEEISDIALFAPLALIQVIAESFGSASFSSPPEYFFVAFIIGISLAANNCITKEGVKENEEN